MTPEEQLELHTTYLDMVRRLKPYSWPYLSDEWREIEQSAVDAGEPYETMRDLVITAALHGADRKLIAQVYGLLEGEDQYDLKQFLKKRNLKKLIPRRVRHGVTISYE